MMSNISGAEERFLPGGVRRSDIRKKIFFLNFQKNLLHKSLIFGGPTPLDPPVPPPLNILMDRNGPNMDNVLESSWTSFPK